VEIVAEAENQPDALRLAAELKPHLAFVDLYMPGLDTRQAPLLVEFSRAIHVILFASDDASEVLGADLADAVAGFVSKRCYGRDLPREIKRVLTSNGWGALPAPKPV
jgi:DNA-binding NarL/FixJ family response regulator